MPTGHSSGGSSSHSGGSFGGSSHGGGFNHAPRGHFGRGVVIINNHPYRMGGKAGASFVVCVFVAVVFFMVSFVGGIFMANASSTKRKIEYDFGHYQDLVALAKTDADRIVEGKIKSTEKGFGKFRIIYEFENRYGEKVEGYSFYIYTAQDLSKLNYVVGNEVELALDLSFSIAGEPDSVPTDIVLFEASDDGEYIKANTNFKIGVGLLVGGVVLIVVSVVAGVVLTKKFAKPYDEGENNPSLPKKEDKEEVSYCEYCGARLKKDDDKCPECGARNRK